MEVRSEESWHDAREDRWETTCEKAKDGAMTEQEEEAKGRARKNEVGCRHDQEPSRSAFRFGWDVIRTWNARPKLARGANRGEEGAEADQRRTSLDENWER